MRYPGFIGPSYTSASKIAADDELINLFVEKVESGTGKAAYVAYSAPGAREYCDTGVSDPFRGALTLNGATFAVYGSRLYQMPFTLGGSATLLASGISNPDDSLVSMAGNGDAGFQIMIASAGTLYCYDVLAQTLTEITTIAASFVAYMDATFFALDTATSSLYASAPSDGSSWDVLDVKQRTDQADKWVSLLLLASRGEVWVFGSNSSLVLFNSGATEFPLSENPSGKIPHGTQSPRSPALLNGSPIWLADDRTVRFARGFQAERVSTHAVEVALAGYSEIGDAEGTAFTYRGHAFYVLDLPTAEVTWYYDGTTGLWGKFATRAANGTTVRAVRGYTWGNETHLVGDRSDGKLWELRGDVYTDTDGAGILRLRRAPHLSNENVRLIYDAFELDMEVGVGLSSGQGSDPQMMLRFSDDGGQTWSNVYTADIGAVGAYRTRVTWHKLGMARDRVFEVACSEPIPLSLIDAYLTTRAGRS